MEIKNEATMIPVFRTTDYGMFKHLKGNRPINLQNVKKIINSVKKYGYVFEPIIVNGKMEIIDGQHRIEAFKELGIPIDYRIDNSLGIDECQAINNKATTWGTNTYIRSYAERGNENYKRLLKLFEKYDLPMCSLFYIAKNTQSATKFLKVRDGSLIFTEEEYKQTKELCDYLTQFKQDQKTIKGAKDIFYAVLGWVASQKDVSLVHLKNAVHKFAGEIHPTSTVEPFLRDITKVYNKDFSNKRYFDIEFKQEKIKERTNKEK